MERLTITLTVSDREYQAMRAWAARRIMTEGRNRKADGGWYRTAEGRTYAAMRREGDARRLVEHIDMAGRDAAVDYCG